MSKNPIKTQLKTFWFDLGNVILPFDFSPAFKRLSRYGAAEGDLRKYFEKRPWLEGACDRGDVTTHALYQKLRAHFELSQLTYLKFKKIWNDIFDENREVSELIYHLRESGFRLILVSNTNKIHFDHILKTYPVLGEFHHHVLSYKLKTRKPNKNIYQKALRLSRAKNHEIFYTDDRADFTGAAARHGIHVHTFTHASKLKRVLKQYGIRS